MKGLYRCKQQYVDCQLPEERNPTAQLPLNGQQTGHYKISRDKPGITIIRNLITASRSQYLEDIMNCQTLCDSRVEWLHHGIEDRHHCQEYIQRQDDPLHAIDDHRPQTFASCQRSRGTTDQKDDGHLKEQERLPRLAQWK